MMMCAHARARCELTTLETGLWPLYIRPHYLFKVSHQLKTNPPRARARPAPAPRRAARPSAPAKKTRATRALRAARPRARVRALRAPRENTRRGNQFYLKYNVALHIYHTLHSGVIDWCLIKK